MIKAGILKYSGFRLPSCIKISSQEILNPFGFKELEQISNVGWIVKSNYLETKNYQEHLGEKIVSTNSSVNFI